MSKSSSKKAALDLSKPFAHRASHARSYANHVAARFGLSRDIIFGRIASETAVDLNSPSGEEALLLAIRRLEILDRSVNRAEAPSLEEFKTTAEWLSAWVEYKMLEMWPSGFGPRTLLPNGQDALYLCGSIGCDFALTPQGTVYINDYGHGDIDNWRPATSTESISAILGAKQSHPALIALLPRKQPNAESCEECAGTGQMPGFAIHCQNCGGLGWFPEKD